MAVGYNYKLDPFEQVKLFYNQTVSRYSQWHSHTHHA